MNRIHALFIPLLILVTAATAPGVVQGQPTSEAPPVEASPAEAPLAGAVLASSVETPSDTLYRAARAALSAGDHQRAIELFERLRETEPESVHLPEARYYEARALFERAMAEFRERDPSADELATADFERALARLSEAQALAEARSDPDDAARPVEREMERLRYQLREATELVAGARVAGRADRATEVAMGDTLQRTLARVRAATGASTSAPFSVSRVSRAGGESPLAYRVHELRFRPWQEATPEGCDADALADRRTALHGLISRDPEIVVEILQELGEAEAFDPCAAPLRETALHFVRRAGDLPEGMLERLILEDPSAVVRATAVYLLRTVEPPEEVPLELLARVVRGDEDTRVRIAALHGLVDEVSPERRALVWGMLEDDVVEGDERGAAIAYLLQTRLPEEGARFRTLFEVDGDARARSMILAEFAVSEREEDRRWVRERVADRDLPVELRAMALNQAGWRGADMDFLYDLYRESDETTLRRQVLWAAAGSPAPEATGFLIRAYRVTTDSALREAALNALGQRDDEQATAALRAILRGEDPEGGL